MAGMVFAPTAMTATAGAQELLWGVDGTASEQLGETLATLTDIDGDGIPEVIAGAPAGNLVRVFSGASGALLWEWDHTPPSQDFGTAVADAGDVNGDGIPDVMVGAHGLFSSETGNAYVYSGADGSLIDGLSGTHVGDWIGAAVLGLGDLDGDGFGDLLVGSEFRDVGSIHDAGAAEALSTATGAMLQQHLGGSSNGMLGLTVASAGDSNGDGTADLLVGSSAGFGEIFSGSSARLLYHFKDDPSFGPVEGVAGGVDFDGDGFADVVLGEPLHGAVGAGHVEVSRGNDLYLDSEPFGPTAGATFSLILGEGVPGNLAMVALTGVNGTPIFMALAIAPLNVNGALVLKGSVPSGLAGTSADFLGLAIFASGKLEASAIETVVFQ
jgi:hypothetical protein